MKEAALQITTEPSFWLGLIIFVLVLIVLLLRKRSSTSGGHEDRFNLLEQVNERLASQERLLTNLLDERLQRSGDNVRQTLERAASETSKTLGDLRDRLGQISVHQENINELSVSVTQLHQVLASTKHKGVFGEQQLEEIVCDALPAQNYEFQYTLSNGRRADLILKIPNPPGPICVDSKFPVQSFQDIQNSREARDATNARRRFQTAVKNHIADVAIKYIVAGETSDFALMFVPSEAIFAEIQGNHQNIVRESQNARVYIVSPTTMMATVTAIRGIVRDAELSNHAQQIREALLAVAGEVEKLDGLATKLKSHFDLLQRDVSLIIRGIHIVRDKIDLIGDVDHESDVNQKETTESNFPR